MLIVKCSFSNAPRLKTEVYIVTLVRPQDSQSLPRNVH
jgi:hypothetical protein